MGREGFQQSDWWTLVLDGRRSMYTAPIQQTKTFVGLLRLALVPLSSKEQLAKDSDSKSLPLCAGVLPPTRISFLYFSVLLLLLFIFLLCFWLLQQQWLVCSCFCDTHNETSAWGRRESSSALLASWPMCVYLFACEKTHSVSVWFTQLPGWSSSIYTRRFSSAAVTELGYCLINLHGATNLHRGELLHPPRLMSYRICSNRRTEREKKCAAKLPIKWFPWYFFFFFFLLLCTFSCCTR